MFDLDLLRLALICPGHVAVCAILYNRLHSLPLSKKVRDTIELLLLLWAAAFLLIAPWLAFQESNPQLPQAIETGFKFYKLICIAAIIGVACVWSWRKYTFRVPAMLLSNHTQSYDVAREIGRKPTGKLVTRLAAAIPGNQLLELDVNEKTFAIPFLNPALDGLSITHLSDLHFTGQITREYFDFVIGRAQDFGSDLIAVTGDLVDNHQLIDWIPQTLGRLHADGGIYYVLGNHDKRLPDVGKLRRTLNECGLVDLGSKWEEITISGARILLSGNELVWFGPPAEPPPVASEDANRPLRILLSHSPDQLSWARHRQFDLMLAGHTHGGQIRLPFIGPIVAPSRFGVKYASSLYYEEPTLMHVSRGISAVHPIRLNCRPELTKIVLKRAKE